MVRGPKLSGWSSALGHLGRYRRLGDEKEMKVLIFYTYL